MLSSFLSLLLTAIMVVATVITPAKGDGDSCIAGEFLSGPSNMTLSLGTTDITLDCQHSQAGFNGLGKIWNHVLNEEFLRQYTFADDGDSNLYTYNMENGNLELEPINVRHHGTYYCNLQDPCTARISPSGYINVISKILIEFVGSDQRTGDVNTPLNIPLRMFGYPSPSLTLWKKKKMDDDYTEVTSSSSHITVSTKGVLFDSLEFTDEGFYLLEVVNDEGTSNVTFTVNVKGVVIPEITLNDTSITPRSYGDASNSVLCSVPKFAFDSDSGEFSLDWYRDGVVVSDTVTDSIHQVQENVTTRRLVIDRIDVNDNGEFICMAMNEKGQRNKSLTIIGPPGQVINLEERTNLNGLVWSSPESFGANITSYQVNYYRLGNATIEESFAESELGHNIRSLCPGGSRTVCIQAVNEYGAIGEGVCKPVTVKSSCNTDQTGVPSVTATSISADSDRNTGIVRPTFTTSTSNQGTAVSQRPNPSSSLAAVASNSSPLAIAAGGAAGAFILIIMVAVLVFAIGCYITVSKRESGSRAQQQWPTSRPAASNDYGENGIDNGYMKSNIDGKSPDSQINAFQMLPSPIPANPGYGPIYIDPHFECPREDLDFTDILYDGAFTVIYKARAKGIDENKPIDVAVKQLKDDFLDFDDYTSALIMEMEQLAQLEPHPNIVGLKRVCSVTRPVLMIMEYMCHGDLLGFLRTTRGHTDMYTVNPGTKNLPTNLKLTSRDLLSIIRQVATGMQFLSEQKIVHGALCSRNILVTTSMEVKIFNIGIHNLDNDETLESLVRWMAPEVFVDNLRTSYGDVWSFGVLMWEVVTLGGTPYSDCGSEDLYTQLMSGYRLQKPPHCAQPVYDIMLMCWETIPQHRPMFFDINENLENMNLSKMSYLDLRNYNETAYSQFEESERQQTSIL